MTEWASRLKGDPTEWLLEDDNPSIHYLALRDVLGKKEEDDEVQGAKKKIMQIGLVPKVLAKQEPGGYWGPPEDFYIKSKYKGTVWNLILLAELYADPEDERIRSACEFVLNWSQHRSSGAFSHNGSAKNGGNRSVMSCLTGNMAFSLIRLGHGDDERVKHAIDWIVRYMRYEIVSQTPKEWPYQYDMCWRDHTCRSGAVKTLKALAEVPKKERDKGVREKIGQGVEYLLAQHIFKKPPELKEISRKGWLDLAFPLMWNTDLLEILGILAKLGVRDDRMDEAIEHVLNKQGENGRWKQENHFHGRFITTIETNGKDSKWVTLNALRMLKALS
ncbi:MAG: hypothetical protein NT131_06700 [Methanomassiliicoccales archaeon]|nr:hypothetical protein [Methanomassiliicoccales archaeon]